VKSGFSWVVSPEWFLLSGFSWVVSPLSMW
jgi:hypothetical protein